MNIVFKMYHFILFQVASTKSVKSSFVMEYFLELF